MTPLKWEVWLVDMPFDEGVGTKIRPALVIDVQTGGILVGKMTSHPPRSGFASEYPMKDWRGAGLNCQTTLRLSKTAVLPGTAFLRRLGNVQPTDQVSIRNILYAITTK